MWTFGGAVGATLGGIACDMAIKRFGLRWGPAGISATALALGGILMAIAAFSSNLYVAVAMFSLCFGLTQLTEASYWATTIAVSGRFASAAGGVLNTGGNVGGILVGVSVPLLAEATSWAVATAASAAMAVVAGVLWLFVRGDREMEQHAH